ncbi:sigma-54-dependent Fis family transcriptional regulator [Neobacillus sp. DY30]|uniref:sigma-54-dependent Fis family transcriptional regulator n=1 Tax=Neobacillus sp. DY30 TaxID=3047871 RepID=UPI0024BF13D7|nr:sigma-54-dependent Fis family transcriptional regulator [Neobacillus sp. DY30]WHY02628.1 PrpR N-terminal domain-containing protein [Neobacillus sp. DY30]
MAIKTLFIAPYRGLKELATVLAKQQNDLDIVIEEADLGDAIPVVKENENKGIQFIISRGGTAKLISQFTNIPVVEIKLSGYDILRTLTLIKDYQMKVHMIGFPNICNDVLSVANLLTIDISYTVVHQKEEVANAVKEAWKNGAQLILGDTITVNTAESFGLQGMMITTGKESVLEVFDQVRQMNRAMKQLESDYSVYKNFIHSMKDCVVIFQESGKIVFANQAFIQKLYKKNKEINQLSIFSLPEDFLPLIDELLAIKTPYSMINKNMVLDGEGLRVTAGRIDHGKYYYFRIHEKDVEGKKNIEVHKGRIPKTSLAQLVTTSPIMKNVLTKARTAADTKDPLIIWGANGVGKKFLASSIHSESENRNSQFVELVIQTDSSTVTEEIGFVLSTLEKTTVYVLGFELISKERQKEMMELITNKQIRAIFSFSFDPGKNTNLFQREIISLLNANSIYMPTLKERNEDLGELIRLFVSIFNAQFGKQVVGIKEEALEYLRNFSWTENVKQLKSLVKDLVIASEGDYIDSQVINNVSLDDSMVRKGSEIDLTKTLEEIEKEVILKVLKEENMNQTKAAKRLGINRTTLWRKIN